MLCALNVTNKLLLIEMTGIDVVNWWWWYLCRLCAFALWNLNLDFQCLVWPLCLPLQGTLKEKTVENLEKYVVKDVSSLYSSRALQGYWEHTHTQRSWSVKMLCALVFFFLCFLSVPTRGSCLFSSAEWMKSPRFSWLPTVTTNTLM